MNLVKALRLVAESVECDLSLSPIHADLGELLELSPLERHEMSPDDFDIVGVPSFLSWWLMNAAKPKEGDDEIMATARAIVLESGKKYASRFQGNNPFVQGSLSSKSSPYAVPQVGTSEHFKTLRFGRVESTAKIYPDDLKLGQTAEFTVEPIAQAIPSFSTVEICGENDIGTSKITIATNQEYPPSSSRIAGVILWIEESVDGDVKYES